MTTENIHPNDVAAGEWSGAYHQFEPEDSCRRIDFVRGNDPPARVARLVGGPHDGREMLVYGDEMSVHICRDGTPATTYWPWSDGTLRIEREPPPDIRIVAGEVEIE